MPPPRRCPPRFPRLAAELAARGIPHREFARVVGIAPETLSRVLWGTFAPSAALRARMAEALDVDADDLFGDEQVAV